MTGMFTKTLNVTKKYKMLLDELRENTAIRESITSSLLGCFALFGTKPPLEKQEPAFAVRLTGHKRHGFKVFVQPAPGTQEVTWRSLVSAFRLSITL